MSFPDQVEEKIVETLEAEEYLMQSLSEEM